MLAFLQELEAPSGANELADALTIYIEVRGGARVVAGESPVPPDLVGRAERLLEINQVLGAGLEASANGEPEGLRHAVADLQHAMDTLPASDGELIAGWVKSAEVGLHVRQPSGLDTARTLGRRRREAAARYEVVLRKLRHRAEVGSASAQP